MTPTTPATNQTALDLYHGWMPSPNTRGTTDILWSCLSTIFLCVWTALHLPVPYYRREIKFSDNRRLWLRKKIVASKIVPALFSVLVPEFLVFQAVIDFSDARRTIKDLRRVSNLYLSITHGFFLNMGGFCLRSPSGKFRQLCYLYDLEEIKKFTSVTNHDDGHANTTAGVDVEPYIKEWIHEIQKFSKDDINALSKADSLTKVIACFQTMWFVTQVISRLGQGRAVTLLEVSTCAYVFSAFIAYGAWWKKPQNCSMPLMIDCSEEVIEKLPKSDYEEIEGTWQEYLWGGIGWGYSGVMSDEVLYTAFGFPCFFGAIHIASWKVTLPSDGELWMWRSSTIFCTGIFINCIIVVVVFFYYIFDPLNKEKAYLMSCYISLALYAVVRLYMVFEDFFSMRALPLSAFNTVSWSAAVPHI